MSQAKSNMNRRHFLRTVLGAISVVLTGIPFIQQGVQYIYPKASHCILTVRVWIKDGRWIRESVRVSLDAKGDPIRVEKLDQQPMADDEVQQYIRFNSNAAPYSELEYVWNFGDD